MWRINDKKSGIFKAAGSRAESYSLEMSGRRASFIARFGRDERGRLRLVRHVVFPSLRTRPNDTHASFQADVPQELSILYKDGEPLTETAESYAFDGVLSVVSSAGGCVIKRLLFPSARDMNVCEIISITNDSPSRAVFSVRGGRVARAAGPFGINMIERLPAAPLTLLPGQRGELAVCCVGRLITDRPTQEDAYSALEGRRGLIERLVRSPELETGDEYVDLMFRFAKLRAGESVFSTRGGLMHSPGGGAYYAAVWCNDQCEYSSPWFGCTGDEELLEAALNAYRLYIPFMDESYAPIPSSIIAEGLDFWNGAGDRGDAAMYLSGGSLYALARGERSVAEQLYAPLSWCAEYCLRRTNEDGVIVSDSDELEGRFPSGKTNLSASCLALGGYRSMATLASSLGKKKDAEAYLQRADALSAAIERYFGGNVGGYETYRYCEEDGALRAWVCLPLCVGEYGRADGTVKALTSDKLRGEDGLLTREGERTYWDRSLLYALRGLFRAGFTEQAYGWLRSYSIARLTADAVPYPIEAYPEGDRRQLSAESALYCRVITEGLFGITPTGLDSFSVNPRLPAALNRILLKKLRAYGGVFDISAEKDSVRVQRSDEPED